ncbi:MAG: response regulator transcription factor [Kineosporiaceae bacterium]
MSPDSTPAPASSASVLTDREAEVLAAVARGLSTRGIADELCLSTRTVRNYLSRSYGKIGVAGRVEATLWWLAHHPGGAPATLTPGSGP